jgi:hypothetical protein
VKQHPAPLRVGDLVRPSSIGWKPTVGIVSGIDANGMLSIIWPDGWISHAHDEREFAKMEEEDGR